MPSSQRTQKVATGRGWQKGKECQPRYQHRLTFRICLLRLFFRLIPGQSEHRAPGSAADRLRPFSIAPPSVPPTKETAAAGPGPKHLCTCALWTIMFSEEETDSRRHFSMLVPMRRVLVSIPLLFSMLSGLLVSGADVKVNNAAEFRSAVAAAKPGTRILLAGGNYGGGFLFANLRGEEGKPIVITAADPTEPAVFSQANVALHLSNPAYVELRNLVLTKL